MSGSISNIFRWLFFLLDSVVYWFIDQMYSLFLMLTEASVFSQEQIENFASRIYVLISIIMLFRLGFSFVNYIVNPESFTDKQKGGGALIKSIVIAAVLLVTVPTIFQEANYLQQVVFKSNVIERVLLGDSSIKDGSANNSRLLSTYSFLSFFRPNSRVPGCSSFEGVQISSECINSLNQMADDNSNPGNLYNKALKELNISYVLNSNVINTTGTFVTTGADNFYQTDTTYLFNYHFLISTAVGGVIAYILLGFCIDLAIRTVKLGFLQLIAPVPIILSISPGTKNNTLSNWGKECLSTWVSLFIRVLVIIFAINAILLINSGGGIFSFVTGGGNNSFMVTVFVMLGLLLFAKEFPKLLEDLLGIKGAGNMTFNALKKMTEAPLVGGAIGSGLALGSAAAHYAGNFAKNAALRGFGSVFGDSGKDDSGNRLTAAERRELRRQRYQDRMDANRSEFMGRLHADVTKPYSGDTQSSIMRKQRAEERKKLREQRHSDDERERLEAVGERAQNDLAAAKPLLDKLSSGEQLTEDEQKQVKAAYEKAFGGHTKVAQNEANMSLAKSKQEYLQNQLRNLEAQLSLDPTNTVLQGKVAAVSKDLEGTGKQIKGYEDLAKGYEITDPSGMEIVKGIKYNKAKKGAGNVSLSGIDANTLSGINVNNPQQQLAATIAQEIRNGFAGLNGAVNNNQTNTIVGPNGQPISTGQTGPQTGVVNNNQTNTIVGPNGQPINSGQSSPQNRTFTSFQSGLNGGTVNPVPQVGANAPLDASDMEGGSGQNNQGGSSSQSGRWNSGL